jgi:signal transduction histidine kinase
MLPTGTIAWILYVLLLLFSIKTKREYHPEILALLCTGFMLIKLSLISTDPSILLRILNRSTGLFIIWIVAYLCKAIIKDQNAIVQSSTELTRIINDKDKMMSILAHDLKSPFMGLIGYSDLIFEECESQTFEDIKQSAQNLNYLAKDTFEVLNNLLDWAMSKSGRIEYAPKGILLNNLVEEVLKIPLRRAELKGIKISNDIQSDITVFADRNLLITVIRNLVNNAIKYTYPGGCIIFTCIKIGDSIEISIYDSGKGINTGLLEKLFTDKVIISEPGTLSEKGTGLGLFLCREFVEKNGGKIWAKNEPGIGSTFIFTVPVYRNIIQTEI